jgi:hypothetical protein
MAERALRKIGTQVDEGVYRPQQTIPDLGTAMRQDRGYAATSALALVVEAVEALALPLRL